MALKAVKTKVQVGFGKKQDKTEKTMARLQLAQLVSLDELAENINDKTAIPVPTAKMVLEYLPEAIAQFVRLGHGVDVGFGILKPSISTGAYDDPTKVEVKKKRFTFRIKSKLRDILDRLSVNIVGDETVDVDDEDGGSSSSDNGGSSSEQQSAAPVLTITRQGSGTMSVTNQSGHQIDSGAAVTAGQTLTLAVTPAGSATPTATIGAQAVTLTEDEGQFVGTFQMPAASATLTVRTGGSGDNEE